MFDLMDYSKYLHKIIDTDKFNTCLLCKNFLDTPCVITSNTAKYNKKYVETHNIPQSFTGHLGGAIVFFPNDIGFTWWTKESILKDVLKDVIDYLKQYNPQIVLVDNDVMLDDKKLFGTMSNPGTGFYEGMFFSFDSDIKIIKNISTKPMVKKPLGLSSIGVTPEDIEELINNIIKKYNLKICN